MAFLVQGISTFSRYYRKITAASIIAVGFFTVLFYTASPKSSAHLSDTVLGAGTVHAEVVDSGAGSAGGSDSGSGCDSGGSGGSCG